MNYSILYRIIYNPISVFKQWGDRARLEPFVLVGILAVLGSINSYIGNLDKIVNHPSLLVIALATTSMGMIITPIIETFLTYVIIYLLFRIKPNFYRLLSAFILCTFPLYIEMILIIVIDYNPITLGSLYYHLASENPIFFGMVSSITPFFFWTVCLWWIALPYLFEHDLRSNIIIVSSLFLLNIFVNGITNYFIYFFFHFLALL